MSQKTASGGAPAGQGAQFSAAMDRLGPFERAPAIAAAVSGGPDSVAMAWLLIDWLASRGGSLKVLTVDHGLRSDSAADCDFVVAMFSGRPGVSVEILRWQFVERPSTGVQASAREARYRLLSNRCRDLGLVHLCVGHTLDDQAETVLLRRAHDSTPYGLAAMPACRPLDGVRLLRPMLEIERADLILYLRHRGCAWREDPANLSDRFERVRLRHEISGRQYAHELVGAAIDFGLARDRVEREAARILSASARIHDSGFAMINLHGLPNGDEPALRFALASLLRSIGGGKYLPSPRHDALLGALLQRRLRTATLAGCIASIRWGAYLYISRETTRDIEIRTGESGWAGRWDDRFDVAVSGVAGNWRLRALGSDGLQKLARDHAMSLKDHEIPVWARTSLPSLWQGEEPICVPQIGWGRGLKAVFRPRQSATGIGFPVAVARSNTM